MSLDQSIINQTISDYNLIADKFSSTRESISSDLLDIANVIPKDKKVLDYGCGNGRMAQFFAAKYYFGVDPSESLLNIARKKYPSHNFEQILPCQFNKEWIFDNIICLSVLHHLPSVRSQKSFVKGLYDSLSKGGKLILSSWRSNDSAVSGLTDVPFVSGNTKIIRKIYYFKPSELEHLLKEVGFKIVRNENIPRNRGLYSNIEIEAEK